MLLYRSILHRTHPLPCLAVIILVLHLTLRHVDILLLLLALLLALLLLALLLLALLLFALRLLALLLEFRKRATGGFVIALVFVARVCHEFGKRALEESFSQHAADAEIDRRSVMIFPATARQEP